MKVAIVGSRDFGNERTVTNGKHVLIQKAVMALSKKDYVVTGGADGADHWAEAFARYNHASRIIHEADWPTHGRSAGPIRNALIVADADCVLAFYTDMSSSKGTSNCVAQARKKGIPVYEFDAATEDYPSWLDTWYDEMVGLSRKSREGE